MPIGARAERVSINATVCGFDSHSRKWIILLNVYFHFFALVSRQSAALSFATQHAMPSELGGKWGTECPNTRFSLLTLLCAGYSVKLIWFFYLIYITFTLFSFHFKDLLTEDGLLPWYTALPLILLHRLVDTSLIHRRCR